MMKKDKGMTLLEVLIALMIFSTSAIALLKVTQVQGTGLGLLEEKTIAELVAQNQLVQLKLEKRWPGKTWIKGESEMANKKWYWRWHGVDTADSDLRAIDIEVHTDQAFTSARASLRTYVVK